MQGWLIQWTLSRRKYTRDDITGIWFWKAEESLNYKMKKKKHQSSWHKREEKKCWCWQKRITDFNVVRKKGFGHDFKPGIVSYPNDLKNAPSMSQLIHCRKNHSILHDISSSTTCKTLHFTYLFFYQTTRSFAVVLSQAEISLVCSMNKHQRRWLVLLQQTQQLHFWTELCEMPPAVQPSILWLVRTTA